MANQINLCGITDNHDIFYRYKMAKLNVEYQKNKTLITNIPNVCKDLDRSDKLLVDFLQYHFAIAVTYKNDIFSTTNMKLKYDDYLDALKLFIEYLVLCPTCKLPETILEKNKHIELKCKCCSFAGPINKTNIKAVNKSLEKLKKTAF